MKERIIILISFVIIYSCGNENRKISLSYDNIDERNLIYSAGNNSSASNFQENHSNFKEILYINKDNEKVIKVRDGSEIIGSRIEEVSKTKNGWIIKRIPIKYDPSKKNYLLKISETDWVNIDSAVQTSYYEYYWINNNVDTIKGPYVPN